MADEFDPFDVDNLRLWPETAAELVKARGEREARKRGMPTTKAKAKVPGITFVMFPKIWWEGLAAARAGGSTYRVALCLMYEAVRSKHFRSGPAVVKLSNSMLKKWGVGREGKGTALRTMRGAALVSVEERPRKSPLVTVRFVD
jgi:hypothetical protein